MSDYALPPLLSTKAVAARYGCDARAARRIMHEAGALAAAGRLLVRVDALDTWERDRTNRANAEAGPRPSGGRIRPQADRARLVGLREGWWRGEGC